MNYNYSDEEKILRETARSFFAENLKSARIRELEEDEKGYCPRMWETMAEFGWMAPMIPEEYGGFDSSFFDLSIILEEMGYAGYAGPYFSTVVYGVLTILKAGSEAQKQRLLEDICLGKRIVALAWDETGDGIVADDIATRAERTEDGYVLTGTKMFVADAHVADTIICAARAGAPGSTGTEGISLFLVDGKAPGIAVTVLDTMAKDKLCEVVFHRVRVGSDDLLGEVGQGWPVLTEVLRDAAVAKCAEMVGGARKVLETTVEYAKTRKQFGSPIGSFQAIQHHCANMLTYLDTSWLLTFQACKLISRGAPHEMEAAMCKAWVGEAYRKLAALGHQVMGGVGFMEEADLQIYYRRAKAAEMALGDGTHHREIVAQQMGL